MAKLQDINKILIIGSGPLSSGRRASSTTRAPRRKALREEGWKSLANSIRHHHDRRNDRPYYIEPLTVDSIERSLPVKDPTHCFRTSADDRPEPGLFAPESWNWINTASASSALT